jgi:hypothetical protein
MTQETEESVRALEHQNSLKSHLFHLVHVNYYCKHRSGCEAVLAEFSFVDGVRKTYHAFINPGQILLTTLLWQPNSSDSTASRQFWE